ncbi:MAG: AAA family ATPase [Bacilli bacterium]|nr:AAA family ATPase [Bacilli bacterium]
MIKYEEELIKVLKQSEKEAINLKHGFIGTEHFLIGTLSQNNELSNILKKEINKNFLINETNKYIKKEKNVSFPIYTPLLKKIILESTNKNDITLRNVILNILKNNDGIAITILNNQKTNINKLINKLSINKTLKYGINLNEKVKNKNYIPIVGRTKEINELIEALCKKDKNNAILIGEAGVGKTAIIEALAYKINKGEVPKELQNKKIIEICMSSVISGTRYRGEFEEKMEKIIDEFKENEEYILFIDEIHTMVGTGGSDGAIDASNILKPSLARNEIKCIGATTTSEYKKSFLKDKALNRRFQIINIEEPTQLETLNILKNTKKYYEKFHNVKISTKELNTIIKLASNDKSKKEPDRSLEMLDLICTKAKINKPNINIKINELLKSKNSFIKEKNYKEAKNIDKIIKNFKNEKITITKKQILETLGINKNEKILGFKI